MSSDPVTGKEWNGISMFVHRSDLYLFLWIDFFFFFLKMMQQIKP